MHQILFKLVERLIVVDMFFCIFNNDFIYISQRANATSGCFVNIIGLVPLIAKTFLKTQCRVI